MSTARTRMHSIRSTAVTGKCDCELQMSVLTGSGKSPEQHPSPHSHQMKTYIATYSVSPSAPKPHNQGFECGSTHDLRGFVRELKRVKDNGVVVSAMFNGDTAVIAVDAPNGL